MFAIVRQNFYQQERACVRCDVCGTTERTRKVSLLLHSFHIEIYEVIHFIATVEPSFVRKIPLHTSSHIAKGSNALFQHTMHCTMPINKWDSSQTFVPYQILKYLAISVGVLCSAKCTVGECRQRKGESETAGASTTQDSSWTQSWHQQRRTSQCKITKEFKKESGSAQHRTALPLRKRPQDQIRGAACL